MKFLADECCDLSMVQSLRREGHLVDYIQESEPGQNDDDVLTNAYLEKKVLITEDKDFGELVYRLKKKAYSIILLRFSPSQKHEKMEKMNFIANQLQSKLKGNFLVVDAEKIRIRPLQM